jgi:hypothetical protein
MILASLTFLLFLSGARLLVKLALFASLSMISLYFLHSNLWGTTPVVSLGILAVLFLPGGHGSAVYSWITILGGIALIYTLARQMPTVVLLRLVVSLMVSVYAGLLSVVAFHSLDAAAFTVFLSVLYLFWFGWVHAHPLEHMRLHIA